MEKLSCLLTLLVLSLKVAKCVLDALMSKSGLEAHCWGRGEGNHFRKRFLKYIVTLAYFCICSYNYHIDSRFIYKISSNFPSEYISSTQKSIYLNY